MICAVGLTRTALGGIGSRHAATPESASAKAAQWGANREAFTVSSSVSERGYFERWTTVKRISVVCSPSSSLQVTRMTPGPGPFAWNRAVVLV
jgi:hypothetical protein